MLFCSSGCKHCLLLLRSPLIRRVLFSTSLLFGSFCQCSKVLRFSHFFPALPTWTSQRTQQALLSSARTSFSLCCSFSACARLRALLRRTSAPARGLSRAATLRNCGLRQCRVCARQRFGGARSSGGQRVRASLPSTGSAACAVRSKTRFPTGRKRARLSAATERCALRRRADLVFSSTARRSAAPVSASCVAAPRSPRSGCVEPGQLRAADVCARWKRSTEFFAVATQCGCSPRKFAASSS